MRTIRFPIAGLMLAVLVVALGLAALRNASEVWAGVMFRLPAPYFAWQLSEPFVEMVPGARGGLGSVCLVGVTSSYRFGPP
jgi:hypothetical protein